MELFRYIFKRILYKIPLKLLLILTIVLLTLIILKSNCFASTPTDVTFNYNGTTITETLNLNYDYYVIMKVVPDNALDSYPRYYLFNYNNSTSTFYFHFGSESSYLYAWTQINNGSRLTFDTYRFNGTSWEYKSNGTSSGLSTGQITSNNKATYYRVGGNGSLYLLETKNWCNNSVGILPNDFTNPYISDTSHINDFSFNYLIIEGGSEDYYISPSIITRPRIFDLELDYQGLAYTMNINDYAIVGNDNSVAFAIPRYALFPQLYLRNGDTLSFSLVVTPSVSPNSTGNWSVYSLGSYTLSLTTEQEQQLAEDRQSQQIDNIENGISNINNSVTNVNNSINNLTDTINNGDIDDDYADDFLDLSTNFAVEDPTSLDQIFMILYNAFCEDEIEDLTFTMPFTNQQVTISQQNISARYPQAIKSIVAVFVWGIIGLFVLKDIRSSVNKIAEGSPEDVGSDVKKEVL